MLKYSGEVILKKDTITPELLVEELLVQHPQTLPVFLKYRLHCIGCYMAPFDTLQEVCANYQLHRDTFFAELRQALQDKVQK
ncbi:MAG: DUF1858 domain-containing protein [Anaerolineae bacterium]|nr:DUF1858 domain-containing protein [Anaerolineae bacterium]